MSKDQERNIIYTFIILGIFSISSVLLFIQCSKEEYKIVNDNKPVQETIIKKEIEELNIIGHWENNTNRRTFIEDFCREFEFRNQHLLIDLKYPSEIFDGGNNKSIRQKNTELIVQTMTKADPKWDIIRLGNIYKEVSAYCNDPLWAKKHLVDFSQIPDFRNNTLPHLLSEKTKEQWGGIVPGPYLEGNYWTLFTNKNVTDKLGINIKSIGMTIDDFISYLKAVNQYNHANPHDYIIPIHEAGNTITSFALAFQLYASALNNNSELFNKEVTTNKLDAWNKTLKVLEEIAQLNAFKKGYEKTTLDDIGSDILDEKCLFFINGTWMYNTWEKTNIAKIKNIYAAELPVFNPVNLYPSSYFITWGVLKNSPNRDDAIKLLLELNKPEVADLWVQKTKCPTGIKGIMNDHAFGTDPFEKFSNHIQSNYGGNIYNFSNNLSKYINGNGNSKNTYYREVLNGKLSASEAMELIKSSL